MKIYYTLAAVILLVVSSCNISRTGCYTGSTNSVNQQHLAVALESSSTTPSADNAIIPVQPPAMREAEPLELSSAYLVKDSLLDEPILLALAAEENVNSEGDVSATTITAIMADNLRYAATAMEGRFAKRLLNKSASRVEKMNFASATQGKVTVMDKIRAKVSHKLLLASAPPGDGSVLAIVSLITGILAFAWYASFVLGVVAIVTGAIALAKGTPRRGMALAGLILGAIAIALWAGILGGGLL